MWSLEIIIRLNDKAQREWEEQEPESDPELLKKVVA